MANSAITCPVCSNLMTVDGTNAGVLRCSVNHLEVIFMDADEFSHWTRS